MLKQAKTDSTEAKLRVLVCAYSCVSENGIKLIGGEAILGWSFVSQLGRSYSVCVLTAAKNRAGIEEALRRDPLPDVHFHYLNLPSWLQPLQGFQGGIQLYAYLWQLRAYFAAHRLHKRLRFDVFHHVTYANDWMASFIGALLPVPYIRGPGGGAHRSPKDFLCEYSLSGRLAERIRGVGQWILRHDPFFIMGQRRAKVILVCNREALEAIPRTWQHKAHLFPVNGISWRDMTLAKSAGESRKGFRVASAGKLLQIKGFALALRSFKVFADRSPRAEFTIVGEGPERPRLEALIDELGLADKVRIENWMPRGQLLEEIAACDVFLFPSLRDGGGAVVVEAMAAGKPVICLDLAGPAMHVTDACGIRVPANSPEQAASDMALALERLCENEELRHRMGSAGRERAEKFYRWERLGEHLLEIYRDALQGEPSSLNTRGNDECIAAAAGLHQTPF